MNEYEVLLYPAYEGGPTYTVNIGAEFFTDSESGYSFFSFDEAVDDTVLLHYFPREVVVYVIKKK